MRKSIKTVLLSAAFIVVLFGPGTYLHRSLGLPVTRGSLAIPGLSAPVEVVRDRWGVPHVYAESEADLFVAQGYVHAQDRLWQMEVCRRGAKGTLAEVLGAQALDGDRLARTLGMAQAAQAEWAALDDATRTMLEAYASGVNIYLDTVAGPLAPEFVLLGYVPEPWQPMDTLACARLYEWSQSAEWKADIVRARLIEAAGVERAAQLDPAIGEVAEVDLSEDLLFACAQPLLMEAVDTGPWAASAGVGATCWAVGGERSATGRPLLAVAPRTPVGMPSTWYEMHLVGGGYDVAGATLPGVPLVVVGRNQSVAWGLAGTAADCADLYAERLTTDGPLQAEFAGQLEPVSIRDEEIRVRGEAEAVHITVYSTRHGPLVTPAGDGVAVSLALRWLGAEQPTWLGCLPAMNRAQNGAEFEAALRDWDAPAQAIVYADSEGNVGAMLAGVAPLRPSAAGHLPMPGWTGEWEWQDTSALGTQVRESGPEELLVAVDGVLAPAEWPQEPWEGTGGAVAERLAELVGEHGSVTAEDVQGVLCDESGPEQPLLSLLLTLEPQGWVQERTMPYLHEWDGVYDRDSAGAGVFEAFYWRLAHNMLDDELGPELVDAFLNSGPGGREAIETLGVQAQNHWFDDPQTAEREGQGEIVAKSFAEASDMLGRRFGDLAYEWNWGRVHNVTFGHALGNRWPLTTLLNRGAMRAGGSSLSVNSVLPDYERRMVVGVAPAYRLVADLSDGDGTAAINAPGQSGNPFSRHYADMIEPWHAGEYHPLAMEREAVLQTARGALTLTPAGP